MWIRNSLGFFCQVLPMKVKICLVEVLCPITEVSGWLKKILYFWISNRSRRVVQVTALTSGLFC